MPTYDYTCTLCNHDFERLLPIRDMHLPTEQACPECAVAGSVIKTLAGAPPIGDAVRLGIRKVDGGFKEVLQKIHAANPKSNLNSKW